MIIRKIRKDDASNFLKISNELDKETDFRLYEPGERKTTEDEEIEEIEKVLNNKNSIILVAEDNNNLIGYLWANGRNQNRVRHSIYVSIGILQSHAGKGIGTKLFQELENWAIKNKIHRIELTVMDYNIRAINLYKKMGFQKEGIKRDSLFVNGHYVNDIYMAKLI